MIRVAICDADEYSCYDIRDKLCKVLTALGEEYKAEIFFSAEKLFEALHDRLFEFIFCEVKVGDADMIAFSDSLRAERYPLNVVFLTSDKSSCLPAQTVFPLAYIEKPADEAVFERLFDYVSCFRNTGRKFYVSAKNGERLLIDEREIKYIEVFHNDICIHMQDRNIICRSTLSGFLKKLSARGFVRCHQSYAVSLSRVRGIKRYSIELDTGEQVPVSKQNYNYVRDIVRTAGR